MKCEKSAHGTEVIHEKTDNTTKKKIIPACQVSEMSLQLTEPTLTSCLLSLPSDPTQSIILGRFMPPAKRNSRLKELIVTRFSYCPVGST